MKKAENSKDSKPERETSSLFEGTESGEAIPPQTLHLKADDNFAVLINWLQGGIDSAVEEKYTELDLTAKITKEARR